MELTEKQKMFVNSDADITFYGGAAGAGSTTAGLMALAAICMNTPTAQCVYFVPTYKHIEAPGGILEYAEEMFDEFRFDVKYKARDRRFVFENGSSIWFTAMDGRFFPSDIQGARIDAAFVSCHDATSKDDIMQIMRRLRGRIVRNKLFLSSNPTDNALLRGIVTPYLTEDGYPDVNKVGTTTYLIPVPDLDSAFESVSDEPSVAYLTCKVILANAHDNPGTDEKYISLLKSLTSDYTDRLYYGKW